MKVICSTLLIFLSFISVEAQTEIEENAWVYFVDKPSANSFLANPLTMLSQRALDRRTNQEIPLGVQDVPVEASYISAVVNLTGITVKAKSKWLNVLHVQGTQANIDLLLNFSFVASIDYGYAISGQSINTVNTEIQNNNTVGSTSLLYGASVNQIQMLNGDYLHNLGYTGNTMKIAVMDAGFKGVESFSVFSRLGDGTLSNGEILGGYDYVNRNADFYADTGNTHGLSVLSTMGGYLENQYIGTAPDAQYYLFVTEDVSSETPLEESLWVEAAEKADSLGVDIINTSLGYTTFDDPKYDYTYSDMDGQTTFISRGAQVAASKGVLLVNSAGNSGNDPWHYIGAPADVEEVLSIGAVDALEQTASFSSYGPTFDGRVKPDLLAQGENVYVINFEGNIALSNGTSFSSPIMSGMLACLWQAYPTKTAQEIREYIRNSGDLYTMPTAQRGYGIPNFEMVYNTLSVKDQIDVFEVFPNPVKMSFQVRFMSGIDTCEMALFDVLGNILAKRIIQKAQPTFSMESFKSGIYFLSLKFNSEKKIIKLIKD